MSVNAHLSELSEKHRTIDQKIAEEMTRPAANSDQIAKWKHEKLKLKDEIARLSSAVDHAESSTRH